MTPNRGEDPEKEASMEKTLGRRDHSALPLWSLLLQLRLAGGGEGYPTRAPVEAAFSGYP